MKKSSIHSPSGMWRGGALFTAALCLLLVGSGCGPATYDELEPGDHVSLLFPPEGCEVVKSCGGLARMNCQVEVDGPSFYVERLTGRVVSSCGSGCYSWETPPEEGRCACPPKAWTCQ